jgi:DNA-binding response OmpR family regulator
VGELDCGGSILVADGDADFRALVAGLLGRVGYATCEAANGYEVLALADEERPRLVLLDVELPGISGYETCRELRDRLGDELPLIFLSGTRVESIDRIAGLLIGADDYITKPFDPGELLARVRSLVRRHNGTNGRYGSNGTNYGRQDAHPPDLETLTPREREVLDILAQGRTQDEIARELFITPKTVATHIQRVLAKLGVHSRAQAVAMVLGQGGNHHRLEPDFEAHEVEPDFEAHELQLVLIPA